MSKREGVQPSRSTRVGVMLVNNVADVPREVMPGVLRCFKRCEPYAPVWLRRLHVQFVTVPDEGDEALVLKFVGEHKYQRATLKVFAQWLDFDDERRYESFVHEFAHALVEPLQSAFCTTVDVLAPGGDPANEKVRALVIENIRTAQETVAEDIKHAILAAERRKR